MTALGLYYPFIRVRDETWLKAVALYWAHLGTLRPPGYSTRDSPVAAELHVETDLFLDVPTGGAAAETVGRQFLELIDQQADHLVTSLSVGDIRIGTHTPQFDSYDGEQEVAYVHFAKLKTELTDALLATGLGSRGRHRDADWIGLHPRLAAVYMSALAREVSIRHQLHPLTDQQHEDLAILGGSVENIALALLGDGADRPIQDLSSQYIALSFSVAVPKGLGQLSIRKVARMRHELAGELTAYRAHVASLESQLANIAQVADPAIREMHLRVLVNETAWAPLRDLEREMRIFGEVGHSLVSLKTVAAPALPGLILRQVDSPLIATGSGVAAAALTAGWTARQGRRVRLKDSPVAYLYQLRRSSPTGALRGLLKMGRPTV